MDKIKIFKMNCSEWYAGKNLRDCIRALVSDTGITIRDALDSRPREISETEMHKLQFYIEDHDLVMSFSEQLKSMVERGSKFPCVFASTEY